MDPLKSKSLESFLKKMVAAGLLDEERASQVVEQAAAEQQSLIIYLVEHESIDSVTIVKLASEFYKLSLVDFKTVDLSTIPKEYSELPIVKDGYRIPLEKKKTAWCLPLWILPALR